MATPGSPAVRRRRLAAELRQLRGTRSGSEVSRALGWSKSKISRYEIGRTSLPVDEVKKLLDFYKVTGSARDQLLALAHDANERGWWEDYTDVIPGEYLEFIGLEAEAASIMHWQTDVIPGLLQTENYASRLHEGYQKIISISPRTVERRVKVRMIRQQVLTRESPPEYTAVLDESILLRSVGEPNIMYEQLQYLLQVANLPNIQLRILPLSAVSSLRASSFVIFSFSSLEAGALHDVVSAEGIKSETYVEGDTDTYHHRLVFQALAEASLSPAESLDLIRRTAGRVWT